MSGMPLRPSRAHAELGDVFYDAVEPATFPQHVVRYHGHQFRNYNPDLGDGRGFLFAQPHDRATKGSGRTPWSRGGDGQRMVAGFVHGVPNTDNANVTGESFDYGPWRLLPTYDLDFTAAYFDHNGLYAYGRQPETLLWNLVRLGERLLPLAPRDAPEAALGQALRQFMAETGAKFEQVFYDLFGDPAEPLGEDYRKPAFAPLRDALAGYAGEPRSHLYFAAGTPCTMLVDDVEAVWAPIAADDGWSAFHAKLAAIDMMAAAHGAR